MEQVIDWLIYFGSELFVVLIAVVVVVFFYSRFQLQFKNYIDDSPLPTLITDSAGKIILVNRPAIRLMNLRKVGNNVFLPHPSCESQLQDCLNNVKGYKLKPLVLEWATGESSAVIIELSGRKNHYRGADHWLLYVTPYQDPDDIQSREQNRFRIANVVFDSLSELIYVKDDQDNIVGTNRAFERFWRGRVEEGAVNITGPIKGKGTQRRWTTSPDGRSCLLETVQTVLLSDSGENLGVLGISHDVTDWYKMQQDLRDEMEKRKGTEVALSQRDTMLQSILESSPDPIAMYNENLIYEACNQPYVDTLGITRCEELIGKTLDQVMSKQLSKKAKDTDRQVLTDGRSLRYIDQLKLSNGTVKWYDVVKSRYRDPASETNGILIMARDVTERYLVEQKLEEANRELERLSFQDGLTMVANRRRFDAMLDTYWNLHVRQKQTITIMLCDIDFFKGFNDNYGHQKGDSALTAVAKAFENTLTRASDCVARYGGEEFAFILPETDRNGAEIMSQKVHQAIADLNILHQYSQVSERLTLSIGSITCTPLPGDDAKNVLTLADQALYMAKQQGRNQTCFYNENK